MKYKPFFSRFLVFSSISGFPPKQLGSPPALQEHHKSQEGPNLKRKWFLAQHTDLQKFLTKQPVESRTLHGQKRKLEKNVKIIIWRGHIKLQKSPVTECLEAGTTIQSTTVHISKVLTLSQADSCHWRHDAGLDKPFFLQMFTFLCS